MNETKSPGSDYKGRGSNVNINTADYAETASNSKVNYVSILDIDLNQSIS